MKLLDIMDNAEFQTYLPREWIWRALQSFCQFYNENEFISAKRNGDGFFNIFSMNIRSMPKHGGELVCTGSRVRTQTKWSSSCSYDKNRYRSKFLQNQTCQVMEYYVQLG